MNTGNNIERGQKDLIPYDQIRSEFEQKGYIVLEEGTKFDLELEYSTPEEEFKPLKAGESRTIYPQERDIRSCPDLELKEDTLVGRHVFFSRQEGKNLYKFPLTSANLLRFERKAAEFQRDVIHAFGISEDYLMTQHPDSFGDVDMSLLEHDDPNVAEVLRNMEVPYLEEIRLEQARLNRIFVEEYLGEEVDTKGLESVRIVTRL
jgi:hypothetical protein